MSAKPAVTATTVAAILQQIQARVAPAQNAQAQMFANQFFKRVSADDVAARPAETWTGLIIGLIDFMRVRKPGTPNVRVFNPSLRDNGWDSTHTAIQIVTDDMPFLVDSVGIAVAHAGLLLHTRDPSGVQVERDPGGHLLSLGAEGGKGNAESLMHIEIDRVSEPAELANARAGDPRGAGATSRNACATGRAMRDKMLAIADDLGKRKMPISPEGVAEAQEFLRWAADDHFTFLGYREYAVAKAGKRGSAAGGRGLGSRNPAQVGERSLRRVR